AYVWIQLHYKVKVCITVIGLISDNDESHCRAEFEHLTASHVLQLPGDPTSQRTWLQDWTANTSSLIKKAHQLIKNLFFLRTLKKNHQSTEEPSVHCHPRQLLP
ncbi:hypothetical protein L3Q82_021197, partial [Scortum barcoo]